MRRVTEKPRSLKLRHYEALLIDLNDYLTSLSVDIFSDKIGVTELKLFLLNSAHNSWSKQAFVQGFYCEYISFKKPINTFDQIDISEYIMKVL